MNHNILQSCERAKIVCIREMVHLFIDWNLVLQTWKCNPVIKSHLMGNEKKYRSKI